MLVARVPKDISEIRVPGDDYLIVMVRPIHHFAVGGTSHIHRADALHGIAVPLEHRGCRRRHSFVEEKAEHRFTPLTNEPLRPPPIRGRT